MAAITDTDRLRALIGESIPEGGQDSDTLFSVDEIADLLTRHGTVEKSLGEAWEMKAAKLSNLVDVYEGDQRRLLSQSARQALEMAKYFTGKDGVGTPKTRVHRIRRDGIFQG